MPELISLFSFHFGTENLSNVIRGSVTNRRNISLIILKLAHEKTISMPESSECTKCAFIIQKHFNSILLFFDR